MKMLGILLLSVLSLIFIFGSSNNKYAGKETDSQHKPLISELESKADNELPNNKATREAKEVFESVYFKELKQKEVAIKQHLYSPSLKDFVNYKSKSLSTLAERDAYIAALKNDKYLVENFKILLTDTVQSFQLNQRKRFIATDYTISRIALEKETMGSYFIEQLRNYLLSENINSEQDPILRKSLAFNKYKIMTALLRFNPDLASDVYSQSRGSINQNIYRKLFN
ncbi:MAG: hypothetical protein VX583_03590 [Bdellovibrionota bacterium]